MMQQAPKPTMWKDQGRGRTMKVLELRKLLALVCGALSRRTLGCGDPFRQQSSGQNAITNCCNLVLVSGWSLTTLPHRQMLLALT
eukprot:1508277-Amphidinium_carterae.1